MEKVYLYAIVVDHSIWGDLSVCSGNFYNIHAIPEVAGKSEEDTVQEYIWELRCDCAESYGEPERYDCENCGEPAEDCECGEQDYDEEEYCEFVEHNSSYRAVKYDPSNIDHVMCSGAEKYRDVALRNKILEEKALEEKNRQIGRITSKINALEEEILTLKAKLEELKNA